MRLSASAGTAITYSFTAIHEQLETWGFGVKILEVKIVMRPVGYSCFSFSSFSFFFFFLPMVRSSSG